MTLSTTLVNGIRLVRSQWDHVRQVDAYSSLSLDEVFVPEIPSLERQWPDVFRGTLLSGCPDMVI